MIVIIVGVTGAGKTEIGSRLAAELGWTFYDADRFHSTENVEKMRLGIPLTDSDRAPWLVRLCLLLRDLSDRGTGAVLACSGLKESYRRQLLSCAGSAARLVYLKGDFDLIHRRLMQRRGHFMDPALLASQFDALEEPVEGALVVDVHPPPEEIVQYIRRKLKI